MLNTQEQNLLESFESVEYSGEGYHQMIMDIMYRDWQKLYKDKNYEFNVDLFLKERGEVAALAVLSGKMNQQVCNGGFIQYFYNKYSGTDEELHNTLIKLLTTYFPETNVLPILKEFHIDVDLDRTITEDEYDEELGEWVAVEVDNYDYGSVTNTVFLNALDTKYYDVKDKFMEELEEFFHNYICNLQNKNIKGN